MNMSGFLFGANAIPCVSVGAGSIIVVVSAENMNQTTAHDILIFRTALTRRLGVAIVSGCRSARELPDPLLLVHFHRTTHSQRNDREQSLTGPPIPPALRRILH
ncbi:unnamed protein product, partial [Ectocarpus sp. 12 AP-2014]